MRTRSHFPWPALSDVLVAAFFTAAACVPVAAAAQAPAEVLKPDPRNQEAQRLGQQAAQLEATRPDEAMALAARAQQLLEATQGKDSVYVAWTLDIQANAQGVKGDFGKSVALLERALEIRKKRLGERHGAVANAHHALAMALAYSGQNERAALHSNAALERMQALSPFDPRSLPAWSLRQKLAVAMGDAEGAVGVGKNMLLIVEKAHGKDSAEAASARVEQAENFKQVGRPRDALQLYQVVDADLARLQKPARDRARVKNSLAELHRELGEMDRAAPLYDEALAMLAPLGDEVLGDVATITQNRGILRHKQAQFGAAEADFTRALELQQRVLGLDALEVSYPLNNLAELYRSMARFDDARPLYDRALYLREKHVGRQHPLTATVLMNLALWAMDQGRLEDAVPWMEEATTTLRITAPPTHPLNVTGWQNLAALYMVRGDLPSAHTAATRALEALGRGAGAQHPLLLPSTTRWGLMQLDAGLLDDARATLTEALKIAGASRGPTHPETALALLNLAEAERRAGRNAAAKEHLSRARTLLLQAHPSGHPLVAAADANLAALASDAGDLAAAERHLRAALAAREARLGTTHPDTTDTMASLAGVLFMQARRDAAVDLLWERESRREAFLRRVLEVGSESEKLQLHALVAAEMEWLHGLLATFAPGDARMVRLVLLSSLRNRGRVLDMMGRSAQVLRQRMAPADVALLDELNAVRARAGSLAAGAAMATADEEVRGQEIRAAMERMAELEKALAARSREYRAQHPAVTVEDVVRALPAGAVLVDIIPYAVMGADRAWGPRRYGALVLDGRGRITRVDLGDGAAVDRAVETARNAMREPGSKDADAQARALHAALLVPLSPALRNARQLLVVPEGELHRVPWGALRDDKGRFLVARLPLTVLGAGRDVLRWKEPPPADCSPPVVVGDPAFGATDKKGDAARGAREMAALEFTPLPATAEEARAVSSVLRDARLVSGTEATESTVMALRRPRALHLATHGFFLGQAQERAVSTDRRSRGLALVKPSAAAASLPPPSLHPMLLSGLALAGANPRDGGAGSDGILTALEVSGMDLWGTDLVVMSACETGLGNVQTGEGVLGLSRAFTTAGARSLVMSLWSVDDEATRELMTVFHANLARGMPRTRALADAQSRLRKSARWSHPYYWAAFTLLGEVGPLRAP